MTRASMLELPFAIAHRGGNVPPYHQNSLAAFQFALNLGYERLETDVHVNSDGEVLALHGLTLDGIEADKGVDYIHVEGKALAIAGLTKTTRKALQEDSIHIPTLHELLDLSDDLYWNIDAKAPAVVSPLLEMLGSRRMFGRVCLGSFSQESTERMRAATPAGTQTALTINELFKLYGVSSSVDVMAELPEHTRAQVPTEYMEIPVTTPEFIAAAERHNIPVEAWTINDPAEMNSLIGVGVRGIFTDELQVLQSVLVQRDMWHPRQS